jgi:hypothetical protein
MKQSTLRKRKLSDWAFSVFTGSRAGLFASILAILMGAVALAAVVRGYNHESTPTVGATKLSTPQPSAQLTSPAKQGRLLAKLSHQPEADKLRRILGQRFLAPGREMTLLTGTLTVGTNVSQITITRTQRDDGEQVQISVGAVSPSMTWSPGEGPRVDGRAATDSARAVIERLALDSPDEFVLAQLRGASYYTVARNVLPKSAGGSDDYAGPIWDVVRVGEPDSAGANSTLSKARSFHINTSTGLIDRCFSQEQGETIVAEISGWVDRLGEKAPTHITWNKNGQVVMELSLNSVAHGPKQ